MPPVVVHQLGQGSRIEIGAGLGIHPKIVSEALGHSSVAFTLDVYSHVVPGLQEAAAKRLDEVLEPELNEMKNVGKRGWCRRKTAENKAGVGGFEPPTCGFGDRCSPKLSYTPTLMIYVTTIVPKS